MLDSRFCGNDGPLLDCDAVLDGERFGWVAEFVYKFKPTRYPSVMASRIFPGFTQSPMR